MRSPANRTPLLGFSVILILAAIAVLLGGCGSAASPCTGNVAIVSGKAVTGTQFRRLLDYTLNFYRFGDATSRYYGKKLCTGAKASGACQAVKSNLQSRMIDQQIVEAYAKRHHLMPTLADWTVAKEQEQLLIRKLGGQAHFSKYLRKLGVAQFQFIEGLQIETRKTQRAIGSELRFKQWLDARRASIKPVRCRLKNI